MAAGFERASLYSVQPRSRGGVRVTITFSVGEIGEILVDGTQAQIILPNTFRGKMNGLCGGFDGRMPTYLSAANSAEKIAEFANDQKTEDSTINGVECPDAESVLAPECLSSTSELIPSELCAFTNSFIDSPLLGCLLTGRVEVDGFFSACQFEVCENQLNISMEDYTPECLSDGRWVNLCCLSMNFIIIGN